MSTPEEITSVSDTGEITGSESPGINPAWNEVLEVLPSQFHTLVTPHFQKWDQAAQGRIEEVNGKFKDYEAYSPLVEHGVNMEQVQQALLLAQEINTNPRAIYDALDNAYNYSGQPGEVTTVAEPEAQTSNIPPELQEQVNLLTQHILNQEEQRVSAQTEAALDKELNALAEKFPDVELSKPVENFILSTMYTKEISAEAAMKEFMDLRATITPAPFAPRVLGGSGGGVPSSQQIDPKTLSSKDRVALVADMLRRSAQG